MFQSLKLFPLVILLGHFLDVEILNSTMNYMTFTKDLNLTRLLTKAASNATSLPIKNSNSFQYLKTLRCYLPLNFPLFTTYQHKSIKPTSKRISLTFLRAYPKSLFFFIIIVYSYNHTSVHKYFFSFISRTLHSQKIVLAGLFKNSINCRL